MFHNLRKQCAECLLKRELWSQPRTQEVAKRRPGIARMQDKEMLVHWLMDEGLMVKVRKAWVRTLK